MQWLQDQVRTRKDADYARRVLDRYRLGMKARGAIRGARIVGEPEGSPTCRAYTETVYHPDDPLSHRWVYRPGRVSLHLPVRDDLQVGRVMEA